MNHSVQMTTAASTTSITAAVAGTPLSGFALHRAVDRSAPASKPAAPQAAMRFAQSVTYAELETDLDALIDAAIATIAEGEIVGDEILGHYVHVASLVRAVSFREGKLLELAVERIGKVHPDLVVLSKSLRLPLVKAAMEAVVNNNWSDLDGVLLDCEAPAKGSYTPDLIVVNRARHVGYILDLKRSLASYGDTSRLEELKLKMMASALVLPDWLYKNQRRLMVDTVGVAIVDGASRPSDHEHGIWALNEIDDLLEIDGAAATMAELRRRFGMRVRELLERETRNALGLPQGGALMADGLRSGEPSTAPSVSLRPRTDLNNMADLENDGWDGDQDHPDEDPLEEAPDDEDEPPLLHPVRLKIGFARGMSAV